MKALNPLSRFSHESERLLIPFVLSVYAFSHPVLLVVAAVLGLFLYRYDRLLFFIFLVCLGVHVTVRMTCFSVPSSTEHVGTISEVTVHDYSIAATVRTKDGLYRVSGFSEPPSLGERFAFKGEVEEPSLPLFRGGFDYGRYLKSQNIRGMIEMETYQKMENSYSLHVFRRDANTFFEQRNEDTAHLMRTFILADNQALDASFKDKASALGVSHLFAVSGMHVAFMAGMLYFLFKRLSHEWVADMGVGTFLVFYIFLTGAPPSVLRAASMAVLLIVVKRLRIPLSALDILSLLCIAILMLRPYSLHDMGFVLSFMVSFTLLMGRDALQGKRKSIQTLNVSMMAFLVTVPIVLSIQNQVNLMSVFYNALLVWFLMLVILPLVYLTAVIPFLSPVLLATYGIFESLIVFLHDYGMLILRGHIAPGVFRVAYWSVFAWMMSKYGCFPRRMVRLGLLVGYTFLIMFAGLLNPASRLTMFPVKGDAFLVEAPFSKCNILIDTGEASTSDALVSALHRKHVRHLDYVVITHFHADHYGGYENVASNFAIQNVITPLNVEEYDERTIQCGNIRFYIYPYEKMHGGENDKSIVLWMNTGPSTILFTGDIEQSRETSFVNAYAPFPQTDMLKAGHHGSNTSSTVTFLEAVNADEVLVSAHPNNLFGHPGKEALERMRKFGMTIHRTDLSGSVEFIEIFGRRYKKTALGQ